MYDNVGLSSPTTWLF